jgi:hypothetical protein
MSVQSFYESQSLNAYDAILADADRHERFYEAVAELLDEAKDVTSNIDLNGPNRMQIARFEILLDEAKEIVSGVRR